MSLLLDFQSLKNHEIPLSWFYPLHGFIPEVLFWKCKLETLRIVILNKPLLLFYIKPRSEKMSDKSVRHYSARSLFQGLSPLIPVHDGRLSVCLQNRFQQMCLKVKPALLEKLLHCLTHHSVHHPWSPSFVPLLFLLHPHSCKKSS